MKEEITTIKITKKTKHYLNTLKLHPKESFEDTIRRVLGILNLAKVNPIRARLKLLEIENHSKIFKRKSPTQQ